MLNLTLSLTTVAQLNSFCELTETRGGTWWTNGGRRRKWVGDFERVVISHMERNSWNAATWTELEYFGLLHDWHHAYHRYVNNVRWLVGVADMVESMGINSAIKRRLRVRERLNRRRWHVSWWQTVSTGHMHAVKSCWHIRKKVINL